MEERIARAALEHYTNTLPNAGKPTSSVDRKEWTVYAAVVATSHSSDDASPQDCWVVSSATGTKCTSTAPDSWESTCLLHDSHAEVLTRRGLLRVLWGAVRHLLSLTNANLFTDPVKNDAARSDDPSSSRSLLERANGEIFQLRRNIRLHMYISDSPCGDASIYEHEKTGASLQFTGAKILVNDQTKVALDECQGRFIANSQVAREGEVQQLGKLRTKSGRSNLLAERRSTSMSCSDKLVRWGVLGLQGAALSRWIPDPIRLSSCIVSQDLRTAEIKQQEAALRRSLCQRISLATSALKGSPDPLVIRFADSIVLPTVSVVDTVFPYGKAATEEVRDRCKNNSSDDLAVPSAKSAGQKRKRSSEGDSPTKYPPTGFSINWVLGDEVAEVTVGTRGIRQGKKPKSEADYHALESRLSRNQLRKVAMATNNNSATQAYKDSPYKQWKDSQTHPLLLSVRNELFQHGPLSGWLVGDAGSG